MASDADLGFEIGGTSGAADWSRLLLFGDSGTGKTMAACRAPADKHLDLDQVWDGEVTPEGDPSYFGLLCEGNGIAAALAVNPALADRYVFSKDSQTTKRVLRAADDGTLNERFGTTRLVIDGLTEIQGQILEEMYPDGLPEKGPDWMAWNDAVRRFLRFMRGLPMDVYMTALRQERQFADGAPTKVCVDVQGKKLAGEAMAYFDAVGLLEKGLGTDEGGRAVSRVAAQFTLPGRYMVKPCRALRGNVIPVMGAWADLLRGEGTLADIRSVAPSGSNTAPTGPSGGPEAGTKAVAGRRR